MSEGFNRLPKFYTPLQSPEYMARKLWHRESWTAKNCSANFSLSTTLWDLIPCFASWIIQIQVPTWEDRDALEILRAALAQLWDVGLYFRLLWENSDFRMGLNRAGTVLIKNEMQLQALQILLVVILNIQSILRNEEILSFNIII